MKQLFTLRLNVRDAISGFDALKREAPKAVARALNRAIASVQTQAVRALAKDLKITQAAVKGTRRTDPRRYKVMSISKAHERHLVAGLTATGRKIPLIEFHARGPVPSRGKGRGVTYDTGRGRRRIRAGFIATMASGHRGVFVRQGEKTIPLRGRYAGTGILRQPIVERFGPSIPYVFSRAHIRTPLQAHGRESFIKNLTHEMQYALSRRKGGR